jgi:hypothetical protein
VADQDGLGTEGQPGAVMTTAPEEPRRPVSQLSVRELDLYGNRLERCLKALSTDARSAPPSSGNWPRCRRYGNHAPKPASPSSTAVLAMSAG